MRQPKDLSRERIFPTVRGEFWKEVLVYGEVSSTNEIASSLYSAGRIETGTVIIADGQEKGRGRMGRRWHSPHGLNLYMSALIRPGMRPADATLLTILPALSCAMAIRKTTGLDACIKWPNDLTISGRKTGGILTEMKSGPEKIEIAIIGIGININMKREEFPIEIREIATSLSAETGREYSRNDIAVAVLVEIESSFDLLKREGKAKLLREWKALSSTLGKDVSIACGKEVVFGRAEDLDENGMLVIRLASGGTRRISAGDVELLPSQAATGQIGGGL